MRIGIDARELVGRPTGVGRYLSHLLAAWAALPDARDHEFVLYSPVGESGSGVPGRLLSSGLHVQTVEVPGGSGTVWEQVHLASALRHDRPDVLFSPAYTAPLASGTPNVLTVHDLSFIAHPEWFPLRMRVRQRVLTTMSARRARSVLTVSEFSRGEVVRRLRIDPDRVLTVPHGLTRPAGAAPIGQRPSREPLVLFVGSVFNRRHAPELIRAVAEVARRHQCVRLEIVGDNRTYPWQDLQAIAAEAGIGGQTAIRSYIPDEVLVDLYARAGVFVFLSDYEGFGLTPLEALAHGVPALVGDTPVAREVYGDAAWYVSTTDVGAVAVAMEALMFDQEARADVVSKAPAVLGRYSWERAGRQTLAALLGAAS